MVNYEKQVIWQSTKESASPLETFLIKLLDSFKKYRVKKPKAGPYFFKMMGSNIKIYVSLKKYLEARSKELYVLLQSVSEKNGADFLIPSLIDRKKVDGILSTTSIK